jgi:hypothetical protein
MKHQPVEFVCTFFTAIFKEWHNFTSLDGLHSDNKPSEAMGKREHMGQTDNLIPPLFSAAPEGAGGIFGVRRWRTGEVSIRWISSPSQRVKHANELAL